MVYGEEKKELKKSDGYAKRDYSHVALDTVRASSRRQGILRNLDQSSYREVDCGLKDSKSVQLLYWYACD